MLKYCRGDFLERRVLQMWKDVLVQLARHTALKQPECLRMPHSTNLTFDLVELHGLKWFNFSMRPTRSLSLGDGCRRDRVNRRVVERHMAASGATAIDPEVRPGPVDFNHTHVELLRLRLLA